MQKQANDWSTMRCTLARAPRADVALLRRTLPARTPHHGVADDGASQGPMYRVVLLNDNVNTVGDVTRALQHVFDDMSRDEASTKTRQAHTQGRAVLREMPQQTAEERCEQLRLQALKSSIEPAA